MFTSRSFLWLVSLTFAGSFVFTRLIQFFADGWQLPTKSRLASLDVAVIEKRTREMLIMYLCIFALFVVLEVLAYFNVKIQ